jgi:hypothetical protein
MRQLRDFFCASGRTASALEKLVGRRAFGAFLAHFGLEPVDLVVQKLHSLGEFLDRQRAQILPNLVREFLFRPVVVIDCRHDFSSTWPKI